MRKRTGILWLRRGIFALLLLAAHILQNTPGYFCVALFEREVVGALFGLFAGALWDWVSPMGDGFNALFLMLVGAACGILINTLMRNNLFTALLLGGCAHLLYVCLYTVLFVVAEGVGSAGWLFVRFYLPSVLYSLVFLPVFYLLVRAVMRRTRLRRYQ